MYHQGDNSNEEEETTIAEGYPPSDQYDSGDNEGGAPSVMLREQDRYLPIANISRIMKKSIPSSGKIAKESKECIQECVSEFISFITSEASDRCKQEKRKTINGEDILFAMATLGFDNYIEPLKMYLMKYREYTMRNEKGGDGGGSIKSYDAKDDTSNDSYSQVDADSVNFLSDR